MSKIVVLSRRNILHPLAGGASRYQHEIFRRLTNDHDITVLADGGDFCRPIEEIDGLTYVNLRGKMLRARLPIRFLREFSRSSDLLVDHGDVATPWLSPLFARVPRLTIIHQLVREIFDYEFPRPLSTLGLLSERALYWFYKRSKIVSASQSTADDLVALGIPREHIAIISPGCSSISSDRIPLAERSQLLVGCVSRLMHYKGIQFAIQAMARVAKGYPEAKLEIAGIGPYKEELQGIVHRLGIAKNIIFLGRISEEGKFGLYRKSRVVVAPSVKEGYGISVIEANSVGTPVVGWKVSGLKDSIIDDGTGLLAQFPNQRNLAACIELLLTNDSTWERLSQTAWKWAQAHSWDRASDQFRKVIVEALHSSS